MRDLLSCVRARVAPQVHGGPPETAGNRPCECEGGGGHTQHPTPGEMTFGPNSGARTPPSVPARQEPELARGATVPRSRQRQLCSGCDCDGSALIGGSPRAVGDRTPSQCHGTPLQMGGRPLCASPHSSFKHF
ncbi:hypothetical protein AAFF_G00147150 [Aldrovandia affinis]|uniref:Uncharacterized protein n=1 Tax=Aldrovandia affinis TaxID=143900 RepID=A0AAD7RPV9_9TELE|nr:hypothetical protein AAFF_G00147150 [Aldrovandia affinis]